MKLISFLNQIISDYKFRKLLRLNIKCKFRGILKIIFKFIFLIQHIKLKFILKNLKHIIIFY